MRELFTFDDVLIVPKFSEVESRKDVDISTNPILLPYLNLPIISSNMDTITGSAMAKTMSDNGGIGCLHRFCTIEENIKMFGDSIYGGYENRSVPMVSIGLGNKELERAEALVNVGAKIVVIDIAHGAQLNATKQAKELKNLFDENIAVIVGNFATGDSVKTFTEYCPSIAAYKIGIGAGSACSTRIETGVGYPQLSAILEVSRMLKNTGISVIADGGMRVPGDINKSLAAGADIVMLGNMLAGTNETPGELIYKSVSGEFYSAEECLSSYENGHIAKCLSYKKYRGSASKESYKIQNKEATWRTAEGESFLVPYKGPVKNVLQRIEGGLRSAMAYVGARNLKDFQARAEFVKISNATRVENSVHGIKN